MGKVIDWLKGVPQIMFRSAKGGNAPAVIIMDEDGTFLNLTTDGSFPVQQAGVLDTGNSTSIALGASGTFTGTSFEILDYGIIFINVYSDVASAVDGLSIQQSSDGVNWSDHDDVYTVPAGIGKNYSINPYARYFRIVYTNGAGAQSIFRLQTIVKSGGKPSSHRIQDSISTDDDAELMKSVITGENGGGTFRNVKVTADGFLRITDNSSGLSIAQGDVTGFTFIHKFGAIPDFDTGDSPATIWDGANDGGINQMAYQYSSTDDIDSLSCSATGTNVDIEVLGLDINYAQVTQTITLQGQNRVALSTNLIRVFRLKNVGAVDLAGDVYCFVNSALTTGIPDDPTKVRAVIGTGNNQTLMAVYTVPAGKTGYMRNWFAALAGASKTSNYIIDVFARPFGQVFQLKHRSALSETGSSSVQHLYEEPEVFLEKTDVELRVTITEAVTAAAISGGFDIVLVDD